MRGYFEDQNEENYEAFVAKWVPAEEVDKYPPEFREQYRYTLARARAAESRLKDIEQTLHNFKKLLL